MASERGSMQVYPGLALGPIHLGASLHEVISIIKEDQPRYPAIDFHYPNTDPFESPVIIALPRSGLRLRFDGADQRLRLIEVLDFSRLGLSYKGNDLTKSPDSREANAAPGFRRIYQIFGAAYPGEYLAPRDGSTTGTYVLSWPGVSFAFPLQHSSYSADKDHVTMLGSTTAPHAISMALFEGSSWSEARSDLFTRTPTAPRLSALATSARDNLPSEIEYASIQGDGMIELVRRSPAPPFIIILNQTTAQDLITELGQPEATHKRAGRMLQPHQPERRRPSSASRPLSNGKAIFGSPPSSYSSTGTDTFDADFDSGDSDGETSERVDREVFWCYFTHGMDILLGPPNEDSRQDLHGPPETPLQGNIHQVVLKVVIHGNVPGSYAFNRHRRLRWNLAITSVPYADDLASETKFDLLKPTLLRAFTFPNGWLPSEMERGKVINRTWGGSPSDSSFFLPDAGKDLVESGGSEQWLGNTKLFSFPNLTFEVLENGAVSALTVSGWDSLHGLRTEGQPSLMENNRFRARSSR